MKKAIVLFLTIFSLVTAMIAQSNSASNIPGASIYSCEEFSARVDSIRGIAKSSRKKVFVIFHAGKTESETINAGRLAYVRDFLTSSSKLWNELDVIYARGEKSSEKPIIAFYLGGDLIEAMSAPHNMTPCMDCCEADYYRPKNLRKPLDFKKEKAKKRYIF